MKKYLFLLLLLVFSVLIRAQDYVYFRQVRDYTSKQSANKFDSLQKELTNRLGAGLHYLYPLYQALAWEDKFRKTMGEKNFYGNFSQLLSFAGDYPMALTYEEKSFDSLQEPVKKHIEDEIAQLKNIQYASAKSSILDNAQHYQVVMINEAHNKPLHRAFTYSLLEDLYKSGYQYLAMEMLNNFSNQCLDSVNVFTGYYSTEPVGGELVRKALQIGFKLISYEDTLATKHTGTQRDSIQAVNIYNVIKNDPNAKILVHAGYGHISEEPIADYKPMAWWFKKLSGIDPFTVDQTVMTEGSNYEYGRLYYDYFTSKFTITEPSIVFENKRPFNPLQEKGYDVIVIHPRTIYQNNRPSWASLGGVRQAVLVQPTERTLFFVQAYYANEYDADNLGLLVPADQTYVATREGYYCLYLRKGKYKIVLRDIGYKILSVKDREVN